MAKFDYTAVDEAGREVSGNVTADSRALVLEQLSGRSLHPVSVQEAHEGGAARTSGPGRVPRAAVDAFTRELANLLAAGVPLGRSLRILGHEASQPAARRQWGTVREDVEGGMSLADALARRPRSFPPVYVAMVRAGETGGFLDTVLNQIADFRQMERDLKGRMTSALVYPAVLAVLTVVVMAFLLTYFIPRFAGVFTEFGA